MTSFSYFQLKAVGNTGQCFFVLLYFNGLSEMCGHKKKSTSLLTTVVFGGVSATICKTLLTVSSPVHCCIFQIFQPKENVITTFISAVRALTC